MSLHITMAQAIAHHGRRAGILRKVVRWTSSEGIDCLAVVQKTTPGLYYLFEVHEIPESIEAIGELVESLQHLGDRCLVHGNPIGPPGPAYRRTKARGDEPATLAETESRLLILDIDKVLVRHPLDPLDPEATVAEIVEMLGHPFSDTSYCWSLTASAAPMRDRVSLRLFFLVDRPLGFAEKVRWAKSIGIVDASIFNAHQPVYTAAPVVLGFDGTAAPDPFPRRSGVVYGMVDVICWDDVPVHKEVMASKGGDFVFDVHVALTLIGDHAKGCHRGICDAVFAMVLDGYNNESIIAAIQSHRTAYFKPREPGYLDFKFSAEQILASIIGARLHLTYEMQPRVTQTRKVQPVPAKIGLQLARQKVRAWFSGETAAVLVLRLTAGCGKTSLTIEEAREYLASHPEAVIAWSHGTHEQGFETLEKFGGLAVKFEGREREGLCDRPALIEQIRVLGLSHQTQSIACLREGVECPHFANCRYQNQFVAVPPVRLFPHQYLALPKSAVWDGSETHLIIDESPVLALIEDDSFEVSAIMRAGGVLAEAIQQFRDGAEVGEEFIELLGQERDRRCRVALPKIGPDSVAPELLGPSRPNFWVIYRAAIARLRGDVNGLWFSSDYTRVYVVRKHRPSVRRVLILDATAEEAVYRAIFGKNIEFVTIDVEQKLEAIQVQDQPFGKGAMSLSRIAQVCNFAQMTGSGLILDKTAREAAEQQAWLPDTVAHFNNLRGLNTFEHLSSLVVAGRPQPKRLDIELYGRALWPRTELALGDYVWRRDGSLNVQAFDDPRIDSVLRMIREGDVEQGIGRLRAVWTTTLKRAFILTSTPVPFPTTLVRAHDLLPDAKLSALLLRFDGIAPLIPSLIYVEEDQRSQVRWGDDLWISLKSAERWAEKFNVGLPPNPLFEYSFKAGGGVPTFNSYLLRTCERPGPAFRVISHLPPEEVVIRMAKIEGFGRVRLVDETIPTDGLGLLSWLLRDELVVFTPGLLADRYPNIWGSVSAARDGLHKVLKPALDDFLSSHPQVSLLEFRPRGQRGKASRALTSLPIGMAWLRLEWMLGREILDRVVLREGNPFFGISLNQWAKVAPPINAHEFSGVPWDEAFSEEPSAKNGVPVPLETSPLEYALLRELTLRGLLSNRAISTLLRCSSTSLHQD